MTTDSCDVLVIGAGNAALCATLAARCAGADVVVLERAPEDERGGNSAFTAGAMRVAYDGVHELRRLMLDSPIPRSHAPISAAIPSRVFSMT